MQKTNRTRKSKKKKFYIPKPIDILLLVLGGGAGWFLSWFFTYPISENIHLVADINWLHVTSAKVEPSKKLELWFHANGIELSATGNLDLMVFFDSVFAHSVKELQKYEYVSTTKPVYAKATVIKGDYKNVEFFPDSSGLPLIYLTSKCSTYYYTDFPDTLSHHFVLAPFYLQLPVGCSFHLSFLNFPIGGGESPNFLEELSIKTPFDCGRTLIGADFDSLPRTIAIGIANSNSTPISFKLFSQEVTFHNVHGYLKTNGYLFRDIETGKLDFLDLGPTEIFLADTDFITYDILMTPEKTLDFTGGLTMIGGASHVVLTMKRGSLAIGCNHIELSTTDKVELTGKFNIGMEFIPKSKAKIEIVGQAEQLWINNAGQMPTRWQGMGATMQAAIIGAMIGIVGIVGVIITTIITTLVTHKKSIGKALKTRKKK